MEEREEGFPDKDCTERPEAPLSSTLVVGRLAWLYLDLPVVNVQDTFFSGKGHVEPMDFLFLNQSVSERAIASSFALLQSAIIHACHNTKEGARQVSMNYG